MRLTVSMLGLTLLLSADPVDSSAIEPGLPVDCLAAVLGQIGLELDTVAPDLIRTEPRTTYYAVLAPYISDDDPSRNHGWTLAGVRVIAQPGPDGPQVTARFERFGVPDATLLIPPAWTAAESNGRLEAEILAAVRERLDPSDPGKAGQQ